MVLSCCTPNYSHWEIAMFLLVRCKTKQNKTRWRTASMGNDLISEGLLVRAGEWRGWGEGRRVRNPSLNFQTFQFANWGGNHVSVGILLLYLRFSSSLWQFKPSLYNLLPFQLSYVMFSVFLCHVFVEITLAGPHKSEFPRSRNLNWQSNRQKYIKSKQIC